MDEKKLKNEFGEFLRFIRTAKGYSMEEVCDGICSVATMSRIEGGKRAVEFVMMEALLNRMNINEREYEFVIDEDDFVAYEERQTILRLLDGMDYARAEEKIARYEKLHKNDKLHLQFITYSRARYLERSNSKERDKIQMLYLKALMMTAPNYQDKISRMEILSHLEFWCYLGAIRQIKQRKELAKKYGELQRYFEQCKGRESYLPAYATFLFFYSDFLFQIQEYELCIEMCSRYIQHQFLASRLGNRQYVFLTRAKALEKKGFASDEEKNACLRDYLTAYYTFEVYDGEESVKELKTYIGEKFGWEYIV